MKYGREKSKELYRICNEVDLNFVLLTLAVKFVCLFYVCRATREASEEEE